MTLTIELNPELEKQLRTLAAKEGMDANRFVLAAVEERLRHAQTAHLAVTEAELLQKINLGLEEQEWMRYHALIAKRRAETLTPSERQELTAFSDRIEQANVTRMKSLIELAKLRNTSLETLMRDLGITPPAYV